MFNKLIEVILLGGGLYGLDQLLPSITIPGPLYYFAIGGVVLLVLFEIVRPIIKLVTFPLNFLTLGLFSSVIMTIIIFLVAQVSGAVMYDSTFALVLFSLILGFYSAIVSETL